jgi:hypothetical protein
VFDAVDLARNGYSLNEEALEEAEEAILFWGGIAKDYLEYAKKGDPDAVIWWADCESTLSGLIAEFPDLCEDWVRRKGIEEIRRSLLKISPDQIKERWGYSWPVKLVLWIRNGHDPDFFDWQPRQQCWDFVDD